MCFRVSELPLEKALVFGEKVGFGVFGRDRERE